MHDHHHDDHGHGHHHHSATGNKLYFALGLTLSFAVVEAIGGWLSGSLALLSDAGHMLTDAAALLLAAFAGWLSKKPPTKKHSYGLMRAEIVAALVNGLFMLLIVFGIIQAAFNRFQEPSSIDALSVIIVASIGMLINIAVAWVLSRGEENLNTKAALLHVMADLLGSVAALFSGIIIYFTDWLIIDPLLSLLICVLILFSTYHLLKEVLNVIMEAVPAHIDLQQVGISMASSEQVVSVHDLHIWTLSSGKVALSAHIVLHDMKNWSAVLAELQKLLHDQFSIEHVTLQPETPTEQIIQPMQINHY